VPEEPWLNTNGAVRAGYQLRPCDASYLPVLWYTAPPAGRGFAPPVDNKNYTNADPRSLWSPYPRLSKMKRAALAVDIVTSPWRLNQRHNKGINVLYSDGSADWVERKALTNDLPKSVRLYGKTTTLTPFRLRGRTSRTSTEQDDPGRDVRCQRPHAGDLGDARPPRNVREISARRAAIGVCARGRSFRCDATGRLRWSSCSSSSASSRSSSPCCLPTLTKARQSAARAQCLSNLRSIMQLQNIYAAENQQQIALGTNSGSYQGVISSPSPTPRPTCAGRVRRAL
jgi:prepilin-type processing-associated H-X9-DG protein